MYLLHGCNSPWCLCVSPAQPDPCAILRVCSLCLTLIPSSSAGHRSTLLDRIIPTQFWGNITHRFPPRLSLQQRASLCSAGAGQDPRVTYIRCLSSGSCALGKCLTGALIEGVPAPRTGQHPAVPHTPEAPVDAWQSGALKIPPRSLPQIHDSQCFPPVHPPSDLISLTGVVFLRTHAPICANDTTSCN